jgi:DNA-binding IclR family transcriptional regulator
MSSPRYAQPVTPTLPAADEAEGDGGTAAARPGVRSQTIERAAFVLSCFSASEPHLSLNQLAAKLDLHPSTVYRYVTTLEAAGLLERDEERRGYRLGLGVVELAGIVLNQLAVRKEALDEMDRIRDETGLIVNLAVLFQGDVLHIAHSAPGGWPRWKTTPGRRAVAHCTALGKVLLAYSPWESVEETIREHGWRPYTPNSIQEFERLADELQRVREQGYAVDDEERAPGIVCFAAPLREYTGRVAASISVSGPRNQMIEDQAMILARLTDGANRISARLGGSDMIASF